MRFGAANAKGMYAVQHASAFGLTTDISLLHRLVQAVGWLRKIIRFNRNNVTINSIQMVMYSQDVKADLQTRTCTCERRGY